VELEALPVLLSMRLAETPCGAIQYNSPGRMIAAIDGEPVH